MSLNDVIETTCKTVNTQGALMHFPGKIRVKFIFIFLFCFIWKFLNPYSLKIIY